MTSALACVVIFMTVMWLYPRLDYPFAVTGIDRMAAAMISAFVAWWASADTFKNQRRYISMAAVLLFGVAMLSNLLLHFHVTGAHPAITLFSTFLIFPAGTLLAVLLAQYDFSASPAPDNASFKAVWRQPWFLVPLCILLLITGGLVFYRLGYFDFWEDEGLVMSAAMGLRDQGLSYLADGYDRAWLHSWTVSQSLQLFGESEWSARWPSAVSGLLFCMVSVYVFYKWWGHFWLGMLVAAVCLLTDEFLILFRYTRMYAPLIPVFLASLYLFYRFLTWPADKSFIRVIPWEGFRFDPRYGLAAMVMTGLALHLHILSAIGLLALLLLILFLWMTTKENRYKALLMTGTILLVVSFFLGWMDAGPFKKLHSAFNRLVRPDTPEYMYFQYLFSNGLPLNISLLTLMAGTGLICNATYPLSRRMALVLLYLTVILDLVFMVYLMADPGRDYRYVVHVVPFMVAIQFIVLYEVSSRMGRRFWVPLLLAVPVFFTAAGFVKEYPKVYDKHPWSPRYSLVYPNLQRQYQPGEALLYQNIKTYYLDPDVLAGPHAIKLGRRKEMGPDQFKHLLEPYKAAWIVFDTHKSYHLHPDVLRFLMNRCRHVHGTGIDDHGVEVFYFVRQ